MFKKKLVLGSTLTLLLLTVACLSGTLIEKGVQTNQEGTAIYQTVVAVQTQVMVNTLIAKLTSLALATPTPFSPINPTLATNTLIAATPPSTEISTPIPISSLTATTLPCYAIKFVGDITIPENTLMSSGQVFTKTWRLQNSGSCAWMPDFTVEFVGGSQMDAPLHLPLNVIVNPGQVVDLSLPLVTPNSPGITTGLWMLRSSAGVLFGLGEKADTPLMVRITVQLVNHKMDAAAPLDFAGNYCAAYWSSTTGNLPCPGKTDDFSKGSVTRIDTPKLENGSQDDEPAIILIPSNGVGGFINGEFPGISIKNGDRFRALIGCLDANPLCSVLFQLNYRIEDGTLQNLGSWTEVFDGIWTHLDVDLSSLVGESVSFVFTLSNWNDDSSDDHFFIMAPYIKR